jgi:HTH-like domain
VKAELSVRRQCELIGVGRSGLYYEPGATSTDALALMRRIDELDLKHPFYGSRNLAHTLSTEGTAVNRKCVQRLMRVTCWHSSSHSASSSACVRRFAADFEAARRGSRTFDGGRATDPRVKQRSTA